MKNAILFSILFLISNCGSSNFSGDEKSSASSSDDGNIRITANSSTNQSDATATQADSSEAEKIIMPVQVSGAFLTGECSHIIRQGSEYIGCAINEEFEPTKISKTTLTGNLEVETTQSAVAMTRYNLVYALPKDHGLSGKYSLDAFTGDEKVFSNTFEIMAVTDTFIPGKGNLSVNLYELPPKTTSLPSDFSMLTVKDTFTFSNLAIEPQSFTNGFPGVKDLLEWFALEVTGSIDIYEDGEVQFIAYSDDGIKLYIDDKLVLIDDGIHAPRRHEGDKLNLTAGKHKFKVEYYQGPASQIALKLLWKVNASPEEVIPPTAFVK